jgi:hypothetical protein
MLGLGIVGVLAVAPGRADAQVFFDNYCVSGAFPVCASVRVFTSGNTLTMQVWNLYGVFGVQHTMTAIGLYHSSGAWTGNVTGFTATYVTSSGSTDTITTAWKKKTNDINTLAGIDIEAAAGTSGNNGIIGCPPDPGGGTHWATCASFPGAPYVQFDFTLSQAFSLNDLELRWHSQQLGPNGDLSLKCDTGGAGDYPDCSVVPEPVTVLLLGSGLAGLGGAGLVRRRRPNGDVGNA